MTRQMPMGDDAELLAIARGLVPLVADGCTIDVLVDDAALCVAAVHVDEATERALDRRPRSDARHLVVRTLRGARVELSLWDRADRGPLADALVETSAERAAAHVALRRLERQRVDAEASRSALVAMLGHAMRGSLQGLTLGLDLVETRLKDSADEVPREWLIHRCAVLAESAERLREVADRLLEAPIPPDRIVALATEPCELGEIVERASRRLREESAGAVVRVRQRGPELGAWDPLHLETIVANLVTDALKLGGGRPVDVALDGDEEEVRITVRGAASGARRAAAPDVGHWIVKKLVDAHGGAIEAARDDGGATFYVTLPRWPDAEGAASSCDDP
ncbi:MAG: HAMP domain-containing histidine kinase [Labilithrix sp.]|nr:HAMP domain-containing histidine kinase [Labilithrix sp.]MCW5818221.1 HAMP domain-containing histidine kinase [Labilithrix sp.]